jgi:ketosteroid isomerase-like protein
MEMTRTIVNDFLHYLQYRDLQNLVNIFANDVKWEIPGNEKSIKWLGIRESKLEVEEFFKMLWKETEPVSAEIHKILFDSNDAIIKGVFTTKMLETEKVVTSVFFIHFTVSNGKIVEYTLLEDSYAVSKSLLKD